MSLPTPCSAETAPPISVTACAQRVEEFFAVPVALRALRGSTLTCRWLSADVPPHGRLEALLGAQGRAGRWRTTSSRCSSGTAMSLPSLVMEGSVLRRLSMSMLTLSGTAWRKKRWALTVEVGAAHPGVPLAAARLRRAGRRGGRAPRRAAASSRHCEFNVDAASRVGGRCRAGWQRRCSGAFWTAQDGEGVVRRSTRSPPPRRRLARARAP